MLHGPEANDLATESLPSTMATSPILRPFASADLAKTLDHLELTGAATYSAEFARWTNDDVRAGAEPAIQLGGPGAHMIVAEANNDIIGSVVFTRGVEDDDASFIASMYVSPQQQRQGLGQQLLLAALAAMPVERNVVLYAMKASTKAISFYKKNGFKPFDERDFDFAGVMYPCLGMIYYAPLRRS
jgi:ribosomal protein S18 acetylase RimI-like enzyme